MEWILKPIYIKGTIQTERNIRKVRKLKRKLESLKKLKV